ncbi:MAG: hypothetical protein J6K22_05860 [Spirochaetaceae bacterium]|nr:hypothetical protein [Spirochaetaceae bacterium]
MLNLKAIQQQSKEIFSKIKEIILEHKVHSLIILCLLCLLLLLCVIMSFTKKDDDLLNEEVYPYKLINSYELPIDKEVDSYYFSRETDESWTNEDALQWFSEPDGVLLDELEKVNTKKVSDILEAAP